jgi:cytochrome P450
MHAIEAVRELQVCTELFTTLVLCAITLLYLLHTAVLCTAVAGDMTVPKGADVLLAQGLSAQNSDFFALPERFWPEVCSLLTCCIGTHYYT